jgi:hypothetical protein
VVIQKETKRNVIVTEGNPDESFIHNLDIAGLISGVILERE